MQKSFLLFSRGFTSEFLKQKATFLFWFIVFVPFIVSGIAFITAWGDDNIRMNDPSRWYISFSYRPYFHVFTFLQILFVCHLNYLEHRNNTWKNLRVLPIPWWAIFLPKVMLGWLVLSLNMLLFFLLVMLSGHWLGNLRPELWFKHSHYWFETFFPTLKFILASTAITAIMYWVSYHLKSVLASVIIGLIGYGSGFALFLVNSRRGYTGLPYSQWHPFNLPGYAFASFGTGNHFLNMEYVYWGFFGGVIILTGHYFLSRYKNAA